MANLTITDTEVSPVRLLRPLTGPAAEAISAGQPVRIDTTTGKLTLANGTTTAENRLRGIALRTVAANQELTAAGPGSIIEVGDALASMNYDAAVYLSDTDGRLADAAGTVSTVVGFVRPAFGSVTPDKILELV